jgi:hypothetical protein
MTFKNPETLRKAHETHRANGSGFCFNKSLQSLGGKTGNKKSHEINRKNKTAIWGMTHEEHVQAGLNSLKSSRQNRQKNEFMDCYFDSLEEMSVARQLAEQYDWKPVERKTVHVVVGRKEFDFLVNKTFIEYHPWDRDKLTIEQYYSERRRILDSNGYLNYDLVVI